MSSKINCKGKTFVLTGIRTDKEEKLRLFGRTCG